MSTESTPRINAPLRSQYQGHVVRIVAQVKRLQDGNAVVDADGEFIAILSGGESLQEGHYYEILGRILPDLNITVMTSIDFGTNIGFPSSQRDILNRMKKIQKIGHEVKEDTEDER